MDGDCCGKHEKKRIATRVEVQLQEMANPCLQVRHVVFLFSE